MVHPRPLGPIVVPFSEQALYESLSNDFCNSAEVAVSERAKYLFKYLSELGAQTIVVENDYIDRDYLDDYAAYYARCFRRYNRHCRRLHFFRTAVTLKSSQPNCPTRAWRSDTRGSE